MKTRLLYRCTAITFLVIFFTACQWRPTIDTQKSHYSSPLEMAHSFLADPDYLKECQAYFPMQGKEQIAYRGVYPGTTRVGELPNLIGKPKSNQFPRAPGEMVYQGFALEVSSGVVENVFISDTLSLQEPSTLKEALEEFGCPSLIYGFDSAVEGPAGKYSQTSFMYLESGVEVLFLNFPITLDEPVSVITFFEPKPLEEVIDDVSLDW